MLDAGSVPPRASGRRQGPAAPLRPAFVLVRLRVGRLSKTPEGRYTPDQGLLFLAYMRDPTLFTRVRERLTTRDDLHPYTEHRASALAYVPPPSAPGEYEGKRFLDS